jgi:hypothetical protein
MLAGRGCGLDTAFELVYTGYAMLHIAILVHPHYGTAVTPAHIAWKVN